MSRALALSLGTLPANLLQALLLGILLPGCGGGCAGDPAGADAGRRPNILLIYTDDQRFDSLSITGNPWIETPNLDRIASEGVLFQRAYVTTSRCCPARVSMLTGKVAHVHGVWNNHPDRDFLLDHRTVADVLQAAGYRTAWIGKWHLPNEGGGPVRGFDHWVSYEGPGSHFGQPLNVNGETRATEGFQADRLTDLALEFLASERDVEQPFFLTLAFKNPHVPLTPAARHAGLLAERKIPLPASAADPPERLPLFYRRLARESRHSIDDPQTFDREARAYWELVLSIDDNVGRVLEALEASGELQHTLVVATTDNGQLMGEHGLQQKGLSYEPSIRVPLAMRLPGEIPAGTVTDRLALNVDLMPTLLELAGVSVPEDLQGTSLAPLWRDPAAAWRERFLYLAPGFGQGAVVERAVVEARWKYVHIDVEGQREELLFDLHADPDERENLARDPAHTAELERLREAMRAELERLGA